MVVVIIFSIKRLCTSSLQTKNPTASNHRIFFCFVDFDLLVPSEPLRDVLHAAVGQAFHHALVGGRAVQGTKLGHVTPQLDVVEMLGRNVLRQVVLARIPRRLEVGMAGFQLLGQVGDLFRLGVAAHEAHAGDARLVLLHKTIQLVGVQWLAYVLPQILAVAAWALVGTVGDINGKGHLFRDFLKDDIEIGVS